MDSRVAFTALVALVALLRLVEVAISARHVRLLKARGAVEFGAEHYPWMVSVHATWLFCCPLEVWVLGRPWLPVLGCPMLALLTVGMALRYWTIRTLGVRWSTRVMVLPGDPLLTGGPYRWLRHPNYLGVVLEFVALPLVHTAWMTAAVFSVLNGMLLRVRIRDEEAALSRWCMTQGSQ